MGQRVLSFCFTFFIAFSSFACFGGEESFDDNRACVSCHRQFDLESSDGASIIKLTCNHRFHQECFLCFYRSKWCCQRLQCPKCRKRIYLDTCVSLSRVLNFGGNLRCFICAKRFSRDARTVLVSQNKHAHFECYLRYDPPSPCIVKTAVGCCCFACVSLILSYLSIRNLVQ